MSTNAVPECITNHAGGEKALFSICSMTEDRQKWIDFLTRENLDTLNV